MGYYGREKRIMTYLEKIVILTLTIKGSSQKQRQRRTLQIKHRQAQVGRVMDALRQKVKMVHSSGSVRSLIGVF